MSKIVLTAQKREVIGKQVRALRREGKLPAVVFGRDIPTTPIQLNYLETMLALRHATASTLLTLQLSDQVFNVLTREKQYHSVRGDMLHIDFQAVAMNEKIRSMVHLNLVGEAPGVNPDVVLFHELSEIEVEAFPGDLPESIDIDISVLKEVGESIQVKDIQLPGTVEILTDVDMTIALLSWTGGGSQLEEEEASEAAEPELVERSKRIVEED